MIDSSSRPSPYDYLPAVPALDVRSNDIVAGGRLAGPQLSGLFGLDGSDVSPHLAWSGAPAGTLSYAVTVYDPDAPTASGFWHWAVFDIPASVSELATDAGDGTGSGLPAGARTLRNDGGMARFVGAAPPEDHGDHRYFFMVHAVAAQSLDLPDGATPAFLGFNLFSYTLARGGITCVYGR
jgi:Raf kinase inhibitor-like YbhB/YbcL family protein